MMKEDGRVTASPGSREPSPQEGLGPTGFDPSREPDWPLCGYAPGNYLGKCRDCGGVFEGDKRAQQCLACAVASAKQGLEQSRQIKAERDAFRTQAINRGWNWRLCDAYGREEYEKHLASEVDTTTNIMLGRVPFEESLRDSDRNPEGEKPAALSS